MACPFQPGAPAATAGGQAVPTEIAPGDELTLPRNKRVVAHYAQTAEGARELHLHCGPKEIVFDEPDLFPFGETLIKHSAFVAGTCAGWGPGYEWPRVRALLEQLLAEGILRRGGAGALVTSPQGKDQPSPLPPARAARPRTWDECEAITLELTGRALEPGYLELVVPVFRIGHIALDADGRQVGEANVFPQPLRVDVPTRWRTCIYPGSRYLDDKPMNVSALKAMRAHWPQVMCALLRIRAAYLERFPAARTGMTLGDVQRLATLVLAVATYPLMKKSGRVANGALHPVLSAMFRVTDGLRMATHQMLFGPVAEAPLLPDTPVTAAEIHACAERNAAFHSSHGVCAGPTAMVEEFLQVLVEGAEAARYAGLALPDPVEDALADMQPAFDYGLLGLQAFAVVFSLWPLMTRTCSRMAHIVEDWNGAAPAGVQRLGAYLREKIEVLHNQACHANEEWRSNRDRVYADIYAQCSAGLGDPVRQSLQERSPGRLAPQHRRAADILRDILQRRCANDEGSTPDGVEWLLDCLMHAFVRTQELLALACEIQARINALLGRPLPLRPFNAFDADLHVLLQGDEAHRLPHVLEELERLLGFRVHITGDRLEISEEIRA
jgi:hypothetical protein